MDLSFNNNNYNSNSLNNSIISDLPPTRLLKYRWPEKIDDGGNYILGK